MKMKDVSISTELMASVVVFLVALPLCMGIALASGVPAEKGLITGIIGGLVVGTLAGSPLQVSGPAAGLVVIVWQIVEKVGIEGLGVVVLGAGVVQLLAGLIGGGQWFRAVSPTVIYAMLSGIGVLIFGSQFHVMIDDAPRASGLENLITIPAALYKALPIDGTPIVHTVAAGIGILTITLIILWEKFKPEKVKALPGALIGVVGTAALAGLLGLDIRFVDIPASLTASLKPIGMSAMDLLLSTDGIIMVISVALVASAETLLCASAVDKLHDGERTNYNKELMAQGVGNMLCGVFAALPMTGVIVRSSANVQAGAKTRISAIMHGVWLLGFIVLFPALIKSIPTATLAALLVFIGYRLMNFGIIKKLAEKGTEEVVIFFLTVVCIVSFDLLTGIIIGFGATIVQLIYKVTHLDIEITNGKGDEYGLNLEGSATFLRIPKLAAALDQIPSNAQLHVHFKDLVYIDHACLELITQWSDQAERSGGHAFLEWDELHHYTAGVNPNKRRGMPAAAEPATAGAVSGD